MLDLDLDNVQDGFRPPDYFGWSEEEIQHHRDAWNVEIESNWLSEEEMLAIDRSEWN